MKGMSVLLIKAGILMVLLLGLFGCSNNASLEKVTIALDWYPNANHLGLYIAEDKGYFSDENLEVEIHTPSNPDDILRTVASQKDNFGINYQPDVLLARDKKGGDKIGVVSVLGIVQHPLNSIMVLQSTGYDSPSDLKGKKVGHPNIEWNESALASMLQSDGLSGLEDIELVNVGFDLGVSLISGKVDAIIGAYFTHESISLENQGYPVTIFRMEDWGVPDYYELVLVTSEEYLENNPEIVERFVRAVSRGYQDASKDPQAGVDILKKYDPEMVEAIERPGAGLLSKLWLDREGNFGRQKLDKWANFVSWMQQKELISESFNPDEAFTDKYSLKE